MKVKYILFVKLQNTFFTKQILHLDFVILFYLLFEFKQNRKTWKASYVPVDSYKQTEGLFVLIPNTQHTQLCDLKITQPPN